ANPDHVVKAVRERRTAPEWLRVDRLEVGMRMHLHPHRAKVVAPALVAVGAGHAEEGASALPELDGQQRVAAAEAALAGWLQAEGFVGQYETGTNRSLTIEFQVANGNESGRVAFAVISERWTEDIQILLNVLGIYSRRIRKSESRDDRRDLHEVQISIGSERARFAELIGFVSGTKQRKLLESLNLR